MCSKKNNHYVLRVVQLVGLVECVPREKRRMEKRGQYSKCAREHSGISGLGLVGGTSIGGVDSDLFSLYSTTSYLSSQGTVSSIQTSPLA